MTVSRTAMPMNTGPTMSDYAEKMRLKRLKRRMEAEGCPEWVRAQGARFVEVYMDSGLELPEPVTVEGGWVWSSKVGDLLEAVRLVRKRGCWTVKRGREEWSCGLDAYATLTMLAACVRGGDAVVPNTFAAVDPQHYMEPSPLTEKSFTEAVQKIRVWQDEAPADPKDDEG